MALFFPSNRDIDIACLGRLAVDLYGEQLGVALEGVSTFAKYLGGSSANIAYGTALLGAKSAMLSRVGDEQMGQFLLDALTSVGCDVSQVSKDKERLTALVFLSIRDKNQFPLLFYRHDCADMAISKDDISEEFIARCRSLMITGTHFSTGGVYAASTQALAFAKKHGVVRVLDIDYRPVLWGLTGRGDGESRYIASDAVSAHLQTVLPEFELIIGTEEEWQIAGGVADDAVASLKVVRGLSNAVFVVKRGPQGCAVIEGDVPDDLDDAPNFKGFPVDVMNVLGAGDAFASGLMVSLLKGEDWAQATRVANACGAIVVSRHGCSVAMPTPEELTHYFDQLTGGVNPDGDATLRALHHSTTPHKVYDELLTFAFDHRIQLAEMCHQSGASVSKITGLKKLLVASAQCIEDEFKLHGRFGILCDDQYGQEALYAAQGRGWWIGRPLELPGSNPLVFEAGRPMSLHVRTWPSNHVMKVLAFYDPDAGSAACIEHEQQLHTVQKTAQVTGHDWLLEVIPPKHITHKADREAAIYRSILRFYNLGLRPNWWKLEGVSTATWKAIEQLVQARDPHCRGAVILGLNEPLSVLVEQFAQAREVGMVKGFMVGRSVFASASQLWLKGELSDEDMMAQVVANFRVLYQAWRGVD
jgi:5-dehydro-2-deoxygluconokinase